MSLPAIQLQGTIHDKTTSTPVPAVLLEAWDAEEKFPEVLASALSDKSGAFTLPFDKSLLEKAFAGRPHKVTLKLFFKAARIAFSPSTDIDLATHQKPLALTLTVPASYAGDNLFLHIPANLRPELEALKKHTPTVVKHLQNEKTKQAFLDNPAQALAAMGIPLSPQLKQRLLAEPPPKSVLTPRAFRLLNGQIVTPKVNLRFTDGKEQSHGR